MEVVLKNKKKKPDAAAFIKAVEEYEGFSSSQLDLTQPLDTDLTQPLIEDIESSDG
jgi:hypothetical protein